MLKLPQFTSLALCACCAMATAARDYSFDFESDERPWGVMSGNATVVDGGRDGNGHSLQLNPSTIISFPISDVDDNSVYKLTAWLRTSSGNTHVSIQTTNLDRGNVSLASAMPTWTKVETTLTIPQIERNHARLEVLFDQGGTAWVDDITLERIADYQAPTFAGIPPKPEFAPVEDFGVMQQPAEKLQWLYDAKIGMFVHWGIYSALGKGEWVMENKGISPEEYRKYAYPDSADCWFDARDYDPREWTALARAMGAKYITLTTMHHDGFALFDSKAHNAFTAKQTLNRDLVREFVNACRADSLRVGFYKTLINWRYPGYYDVYGTDCRPNKFGYTTEPWHKQNVVEMKNELYCQMRELMSNYGKIDILFWDGGWISQEKSDRDGAMVWEPYKYLSEDNPWPVDPMYQMADSTGRALGLVGLVRELQPDILMNTRCGWIGDIRNEEGSHATAGDIRTQPTEKCFCAVKGSWGYRPNDENPESVLPLDRLKRMVADCMVRNEIMLINVGPDRHGHVPASVSQRLTQLGDWIKLNSDAIYGTNGGPWQPVDGKYGFTYAGNTLYVWLFEDFGQTELTLPPLDKGMKAKSCRMLHTGAKLPISRKGPQITIREIPQSDEIRVIAVELNRNIY